MQTYRKNGIQMLNQILKIQKQCQVVCGVCIGHSFYELEHILEQMKRLKTSFMPVALWFEPTEYENINYILNQAQTCVEDNIKAEKRIKKVWSEEIYTPYNVRFVQEYIKISKSKYKYMNITYWKHKRALRQLFLESSELFTDEELVVLNKNLNILEETNRWLFLKQKKIKQTLGAGYRKKETDFNQIRKKYDQLYFFMEEFVDDFYKFNLNNFKHLLNWVDELEKMDFQKLFEIIQKDMKGLTKSDFLHTDIKDIMKQWKRSVNAVPTREELFEQYSFGSRSEKVNIKSVKKEELYHIILEIIEKEEEITLDKLVSYITQLLFYKRRTKLITQRVEDAVYELKRKGEIKRYSSGWSMVEKTG